ncbi:hypothetical protein CKO_03568 [Citrobacter koseri ATCC BAA-895]|uniref:Uncharacterized protein n=1 Tax=Citrobacter koseri (strain ATCC BAA-895 / CDC 4225-83 / SGSC4696) TaxID=290338 RepID=A8AMD4_CITK8|nr:hypothetical protein CKO_03568 [Citrobacter koseri ATCC BAA-895]
MTVKASKQLAGDIFQHKQSLRAEKAAQKHLSGAAKPYLTII